MATVIVLSATSTYGILVDTPLGKIKGFQVTDHNTGHIVYKFRGIRYAKPPIGRGRFRKPEPIEKWTGEYDATRFSPICPQVKLDWTGANYFNQSEDCLFLNIYIPRQISSS